MQLVLQKYFWHKVVSMVSWIETNLWFGLKWIQGKYERLQRGRESLGKGISFSESFCNLFVGLDCKHGQACTQTHYSSKNWRIVVKAAWLFAFIWFLLWIWFFCVVTLSWVVTFAVVLWKQDTHTMTLCIILWAFTMMETYSLLYYHSFIQILSIFVLLCHLRFQRLRLSSCYYVGYTE